MGLRQTDSEACMLLMTLLVAECCELTGGMGELKSTGLLPSRLLCGDEVVVITSTSMKEFDDGLMEVREG